MPKDTKKPKLTPKFDPIWRVDFGDLHKISPAAFIIRQLLRLARDLETSLTNLTDTQIQIETGLNRETIRNARRELVNAGYIVPQGYHTYFIRPFKWTETVQPTENGLNENRSSLERKSSNHLNENRSSDERKPSNPYIYQKQNITETERPYFPVIEDDELPYLRSLYPYNSRENLKIHLENRGFKEFEIGKIFERVYPQQYTGKAA